MSVSAANLKAGMSLSFSRVYAHIERVIRDRDGMVTAYVRAVTGASVPVRFHSDETVTVGAR